MSLIFVIGAMLIYWFSFKPNTIVGWVIFLFFGWLIFMILGTGSLIVAIEASNSAG